MTTTPVQSVCCQYHYDPLNRSIIWTRDRQAGLQRFFCKERLATEIQNAAQRSIFQHDDQVLAQQNRWGARVDTTLLATDQQRSVLNAVDLTQAHHIAYMPYGHRPIGNGLLSLLGFNGERPDPVTGHYHLGNGYRQYNPGLLRFNSPDKLSPFGEGGVNAYAYCGNDPVNWTDPSGSFRILGIGKKNISTIKAYDMVSSMISDDLNVNYGKFNVITSENTPTADLSKYKHKAIKKILNIAKTENSISNYNKSLLNNKLEQITSTKTYEKIQKEITQIERIAPDKKGQMAFVPYKKLDTLKKIQAKIESTQDVNQQIRQISDQIKKLTPTKKLNIR